MRIAATVARIEGPSAWVEVNRSQGCGRCHEPGGCGGVSLAHAGIAPGASYRVENGVGARPGERVELELPEGSVLLAALLAYGLPVLGVIGGAIAGAGLASAGARDLAAVLGAGGGLAVTHLATRRARRGFFADGRFAVRLVRGASGEGCAR